MLAPTEPETTGRSFRLDIRVIGIAAILILVGGTALAWVVGNFGIPFLEPGPILAATIILTMILVCCSAMTVIGQFAYRMPQYGEMETRFKEGIEFYNNQDWEEALKVFREQMGPEMNHKRALFYGAKCCEELEDLDCVKRYTKKYLELQPRDKEAWKMLANAHKRLFEFEEAEDALRMAAKL
ncbi:MAG: tetratricopeptide repeat protein [Candidatus Thorarchaeota archaeon]